MSVVEGSHEVSDGLGVEPADRDSAVESACEAEDSSHTANSTVFSTDPTYAPDAFPPAAEQREDPTEDDYNTDSAYGDDSLLGDDTETLASFITDYRYENGRRYHAYRDGAYWVCPFGRCVFLQAKH